MEYTLKERRQHINKITIWGVVTNLFLAVTKLIGGVIGHSQALLVDGLHSLSDLASDGMVLIAAKHAGKDADEDHPYGHARFETLATVGLGVLLILIAVGFVYDAIQRLLSDEIIVVPHLFTLIIAVISILSKEILYRTTQTVAIKIRSTLLEANAWHHRSDAISSIIVFIGIAGAQFGIPVLDAIAAILVALMIAKIGAQLGYKSIQELVDTALEPEVVEKIREVILSHEDVRQLHMLRTRRMGHNALVDVHIQVAPKLSVSEGHHISEDVENVLKSTFDEINDVTVHIDPEDDALEASSMHLPSRSELIMELKQAWSAVPELSNINDITLHYLQGEISVEASMQLGDVPSLEKSSALQAKFTEISLTIDCIGQATLKFY